MPLVGKNIYLHSRQALLPKPEVMMPAVLVKYVINKRKKTEFLPEWK
jgi:hypothetical protein